MSEIRRELAALPFTEGPRREELEKKRDAQLKELIPLAPETWHENLAITEANPRNPDHWEAIKKLVPTAERPEQVEKFLSVYRPLRNSTWADFSADFAKHLAITKTQLADFLKTGKFTYEGAKKLYGPEVADRALQILKDTEPYVYNAVVIQRDFSTLSPDDQVAYMKTLPLVAYAKIAPMDRVAIGRKFLELFEEAYKKHYGKDLTQDKKLKAMVRLDNILSYYNKGQWSHRVTLKEALDKWTFDEWTIEAGSKP